MTKNVARLAVSIFVVGALFLLSCGPKAAPAPTAPTPAAPTPAPAAPTPAPAAPAPTTLVEKPRYGGAINLVLSADVRNWDNNAAPVIADEVVRMLYDQLMNFDWAKGPAGTNIVDLSKDVERWDGFSPELAESFAIPELGTWIFQIRRGMRYGLNPKFEASRLVGGREVTADDVVYNINRQLTSPNSAINRSTYVGLRAPLASGKPADAEKTGPWEVTVKTPTDPWTAFYWVIHGSAGQMYTAPEVVAKYGNHLDWRNVVGAGPYMVDDYVSGSQATLLRNPNYWERDPVGSGKGNQLPYVDTAKFLIVPDISTRLAAMRTGRGDWVSEIPSEDALSLMKTTPRLLSSSYLSNNLALIIALKIENPDLPFKDVRVRQALMMATDFESMKNDLFGGQAVIGGWPVSPYHDWLYVPMDKLPAPVQALYNYNPEGAKRLLADAGYPKGFKTKMNVQNIYHMMDAAAVVKAMWAKVGVDVEIQPRETAVYQGMNTARSWEEMNLATGGAQKLLSLFSFSGFRGATVPWKDPIVEAANKMVQGNIMVDMAKAEQAYRDFIPYAKEQAFSIPLPAPSSFSIWQPWMKNYHGEARMIYFMKYVWIDQDLRDQMTGRR